MQNLLTMQSESRICARSSAEPQGPRKVSRSDTSGIVIKPVSGQYRRRSERTRAKNLDIAAEVSRKRQRQYTLCTIDMEGGRSLQDAVAVDMDYRNGSALKYNARRCKVLIRIDIALTEFRMSEIAVYPFRALCQHRPCRAGQQAVLPGKYQNRSPGRRPAGQQSGYGRQSRHSSGSR